MESEEIKNLKIVLDNISKNDLYLKNKEIESSIEVGLADRYSKHFLKDKNNFSSLKEEISRYTKKLNDCTKKFGKMCFSIFLGTPIIFFSFFLFLVGFANLGNSLRNIDAAIFASTILLSTIFIISIIFSTTLKQLTYIQKLQFLYKSIFDSGYKENITEITLKIIKQLDSISENELSESKKYLTNYLLQNLKEFDNEKGNEDNFFVKVKNHINNKVFIVKQDVNDKRIVSFEKNSLINLDLSAYHKELLKEEMEPKI